MKTRKLLGIFDGPDKARIEKVASECGLTPEEAATSLALLELDLNPSLIGTVSDGKAKTNAKILTFNSNRHE